MRTIKYLFLSYSSANIDAAEALRTAFEQSGVRVWMSNHDIGIGENFSAAIHDSISNCSCFVLLLTEEAQNSPWVLRELDTAISCNKPIAPIQMKPVALYNDFAFNLINAQITTLPEIDINNSGTQRAINTVKGYMNGNPWRKRTKTTTSAGIPKVLGIAGIGVGAIAVILVLTLVFNAISGISGSGTGFFSELMQNISGNKLPAPDPDDVNQIPDFFEDEINSIRYAEPLKKRTHTKTVKVGEYISLSSVWSDAVVYSEDTAIAIGEGTLVKGVSPGETYVIIAPSKTVTSVYYIIVEE